MSSDHARRVEKYLWTDDDFDVMGWHDAKVHAVAFDPGDGTSAKFVTETDYALERGGRLLFDLDYIVEWVQPVPPERHFGFWTSPATLVFENVQWIQGGELELRSASLWLDIADLDESGPDPSGLYKLILEGHNFTLKFWGTGFRQYLRQPPVFAAHQHLSLAAHGGFSFAETSATDPAE